MCIYLNTMVFSYFSMTDFYECLTNISNGPVQRYDNARVGTKTNLITKNKCKSSREEKIGSRPESNPGRLLTGRACYH